MKIETKESVKKKKIKPQIVNITKRIYLKNNNLILKGFCLARVLRLNENDFSKYTVNFNNKYYKVKFWLKKGIPFIKKFKFNYYKLSIPIKEMLNADIQNKVVVCYDKKYVGRMLYNIFDLNDGKYRNSRIVKVGNMSIYLRQTIKNSAYFTIRESNYYDTFKGKIKIFLGYWLSKIYPKKNIVLLYEKNCSRYEESASILYEKLIDKGYLHAYYIVNKGNPKIANIDEKYYKNFIYKDTLKHVIYYFKAKKFIGSESIAHVFQLRVASSKAIKKQVSKDLEYVFLQHGLSYMISFSSDLRTAFRKQDYKLHKSVVSSMLEAKHFIELGQHDIKDLYICGMPKFDRAIRYKDADKIVIMPTWRRWEVNQAAVDYQKTKYFKMIKRIVSVIPKDLHDKVIILPHPLMLNSIKNNDDYQKYLPEGDFSYDDILKTCRLLITDYSSISYDAFYRGSNIIFYWEEKDECLKHYGEKAKLLLTEKKAFGDICYNKKELKEIIRRNYENKQDPKYKTKYRKINAFHDNRNTERLIEMLKEDNVI